MNHRFQRISLKCHFRWFGLLYESSFSSKTVENILEISTFSLNHVIVRPTKIMNNLLKVCKICFSKSFLASKINRIFLIFFSLKNIWLHCKWMQGPTGKVHSVLVKMIGKHYTEGNHNEITGKIFNCYG